VTIVPVILSGGSGTRLWPLSTGDRPKQFLRLADPKMSLFQQTLKRGQGQIFAPPIVVANERHRALVAEQLDELGIAPAAVLLEPVGRNTAPAIALAAMHADDDALLLIMPSDHRIADESAFFAAVKHAIDEARDGALVTFGITPDRPETGYGYIAMGDETVAGGGIFAVDRFVEKPDLPTAEAMVESGNYLWNSGIFLFSAKTYFDELERHEPEIATRVREAMLAGERDGATILAAKDAFHACPAQSIDYGVMERSDRVVTVPVACGWSDLGSWDSIAELAPSRGTSDVTIIDSPNSFVHADGIGISLCGVGDLIVVATAQHVMILPRGQSQRVKEIVVTRDT
jgi:mannose-1-phosphate guanylyltransferase/mannose-1-phosphate guanylyltransferase/mannose-6-phosphate isomerase